MKDQKMKLIFSTYFLGEKEFALNVSNVREVVNPPASYTSVPLASKNLLGMFNLRGAVIPVLDLHYLLGEESKAESTPDSKIAIVEYDNFYVGFLFDKTSEVLKVVESELCQLDFQTGKGNGSSQFLKLDSGKKVIQVLNVKNIIESESLIEIRKNQIAESVNINAKKNRGPRKQCITFMAGTSHCALIIDTIQEIIKLNKIEESDLAYHECIGMIHVRDRVVPIIDFSSYLGHRVADKNELTFENEKRIIVMKVNGNHFGLLVETVESIVSFYEDEVAPFTVHTMGKKGLIKGCLCLEGKPDTLIIDDAYLLNDKKIIEVTDGHKQIYQNSVDEKKLAEKNTLRQTYLTFNLNKLYGFEIKAVKEIIDYDQSLMRPCELSPIYKGVMNLRGDLILIVDSRKVYHLPELESQSSQKVLIIDRGTEKFGLLVDSVNEIFNMNESNVFATLPEFLRNDPNEPILQDIKEAIQIKVNEKSKTLMILGVEEVISRVSCSKKLAA